MTPRDHEEYIALRATIRERGSLRVWLFVAGLTGWAALTLATATLATLPVAALLPLLLLAGLFEAVFALHTGVERIGRYIQVFHETGGHGWEHAAMAFGRAFPGGGSDPLFTLLFLGATFLNFVPVLLAGPVFIELVVVGLFHLAFLLRLFLARRASGRQRAIDLERFSALAPKADSCQG